MTEQKRTLVRSRAGAPTTKSVVPATAAPAIVGRKPGASSFYKGVFFGPPKTGKTTVATSGKDVLLIQFDPEGDATTTLQGREDITVVEPKNFKEVEAIIKALTTTDAGRFQWVVIDSVTFMFQTLDAGKINKAYMENKNIMRPYGQAGAAVSSLIHDLLQLQINVIFTAHLQKEDGEDSVAQEQELGETEVKLAVTPMVWKILGPGVSFIGRTFKKTAYEGIGKDRNKVTRYRVSLNDGERSPAGARIQMPGELEITTTTLQELAEGGKK